MPTNRPNRPRPLRMFDGYKVAWIEEYPGERPVVAVGHTILSSKAALDLSNWLVRASEWIEHNAD